MTTPRFDEIRRAIDATDRALVGLVNSRLRLVAELWELKQGTGLERVDPGREAAIRAALTEANGGPLSTEGLDELVTALLALTKREMGRAARADQ